MNAIVNLETSNQLDKIAADLPQSLLLTGMRGVGLYTIANEMSNTVGSIPIVIKPQLISKASTIEQISIDAIRELYTSLRGKRSHVQVVIVDDADTMTASAQNSFLKLLEEPPSSVRFILTSHRPEKLLATVRSRVQTQYVSGCSSEQSDQLLASCKSLSDTEQRQVAFIAKGLPAEILRMANDEKYRKQVIAAMTKAKKILEASVGERAALIAGMPTDRKDCLLVIDKMVTIIQLQPNKSGVALLENLLEAYQRIQKNGNVRLQLAAAMV